MYSKVGSLYDLQGFIISCYTTVASIDTSQNMFLLICPDEDQSVLRMSTSTCRQKHNRNVFYLIYFAPVCWKLSVYWIFWCFFFYKLNIILYIWVLICIYFLFCAFFPIYWFQMIYFANYLGFKGPHWSCRRLKYSCMKYDTLVVKGLKSAFVIVTMAMAFKWNNFLGVLDLFNTSLKLRLLLYIRLFAQISFTSSAFSVTRL